MAFTKSERPTPQGYKAHCSARRLHNYLIEGVPGQQQHPCGRRLVQWISWFLLFVFLLCSDFIKKKKSFFGMFLASDILD